MNVFTSRRNKKIILLLGDLVLLYLGLLVTLVLRYQNGFSWGLALEHFWPFTPVFIFWLVVFYIDDLYNLSSSYSPTTFFSRIIRDSGVSLVVAATFFYFATDRLFSLKPQRILLIEFAVTIILLTLYRYLYYRYTKAKNIRLGLLVIGFNPLVLELADRLKENSYLGYELKSLIVDDASVLPEDLRPLAKTNDLSRLKEICEEQRIDTIVSVDHPRNNPELVKNLFTCLPLKINFFDIASFYEKVTGKIPVSAIEQVWFLENFAEQEKTLYETWQRVSDLLLALVFMICSLPFWPVIALLIKLDSKGPIFFSQIRTGKNEKTFKVIKFRTMKTDAEKNGPQWAQTNDPRITKLGKFMRKSRIDELPQLINIIKGEMSLIGPRPERPEFVKQLAEEIPFYKERLLIKPGLTGWAQVVGPSYGGSKEETLEKLQYDLYYVKNRSTALDLSIILKTIKIVLSRKGQ